MPLLPIRLYGDPVLSEIANPVAKSTPALRRLADDMIETMYDARGLGLAANQIGETQRRIIIIDPDYASAERDESGRRKAPVAPKPRVMINPEIVEHSVEDESYNEGCLSIPGVEADVWRPSRVRVKWQDLEGKTFDEWTAGLMARVIQHEIDHLNGVLFIDHLSPIKRRMLAGKLSRVKKWRAEG